MYPDPFSRAQRKAAVEHGRERASARVSERAEAANAAMGADQRVAMYPDPFSRAQRKAAVEHGRERASARVSERAEAANAAMGADQRVGVVPHIGFEPMISALRGRCPGPLDECGTDASESGTPPSRAEY